MYSLESFNSDTLTDILMPVTESYGGADSRVWHVEKFAVHQYKDHVDLRLFQHYLNATLNAAELLTGLVQVPQSDEQVMVSINPILSWFIARSGSLISVSDWVSGESGSALKNDKHRNHYLSILTPMNEILKNQGNPMGADIIAMNTRYQFPFMRTPKCIVTDVGNGLRYLRPNSRW